MQTPRKVPYIRLPGGDVMSLAGVHGVKTLPDGRFMLVDSANNALAVGHPEDYPDVASDIVMLAIQEMVANHLDAELVIMPEWMRKA